MAYTYTAWPTLTNVKDLIAGAHVDTTASDWDVTDEYITGLILARAEQIKMLTSRQFVAGSSGEVRYFDGSGTGLLRIDEYVDVSEVAFFYVPGSAFLSITNFYEPDQKPWGKDKLQILQGQANLNYAFLQRFPEGRGNIKVTGTWGYGSSIPPDVFLAVLEAAAADAMQANAMSAQGQAKKWVDGDAAEEFTGDLLGIAAGWLGKGSRWEMVVRNYKRSLKSHLSKSHTRLL